MAAIELGAPYTVLDPTQVTSFDINDETSDNYVGRATSVTGLDSPEIRESALDLPAGDGGINAPFWFGRRPWTIEGIIMPQFPINDRNNSQERIQNVLFECLRQDGFLVWTNSHGNARFIKFRTQLAPRTGNTGQSNADKRFVIAGVASDPLIYGIPTGSSFAVTHDSERKTALAVAQTPGVIATCEGGGGTKARAQFIITGPIGPNYTLTNLLTGKRVTFRGPTLREGNVGVLDFTHKFVYYHVDRVDFYKMIDHNQTNWDIAVMPGVTQDFVLSGDGITEATKLEVKWRHTWR